MANFVLFLGRAIVGLTIAGHGAQKLFGWFEGPGFDQWTSVTESKLGMRPGKFWGTVSIAGEFGGGLLTALGFLNPLGPIAAGTAMLAAAYKGHWGKPFWSSKGGPELAVSLFAGSLLVAGSPERLSLDALLGIRVPRWATVVALLGSAGLLAETIRPTVTPRLAEPPPSEP